MNDKEAAVCRAMFSGSGFKRDRALWDRLTRFCERSRFKLSRSEVIKTAVEELLDREEKRNEKE